MSHVLKILPANLADNGYTTDLTDYYRCSTFARLIVDTDATRVWCKAWTSIYATSPAWAHIGVWAGGQYQVLAATGTGLNTPSVDLPAGMKRVELVAGVQSLPVATVVGTFPKVVYFSGGRNCDIITPPASPNRLLVYGDSISVGCNATYPTHQGWTMLLRQSRGDVMAEGHGFRTLYEDAVDATARQAFADRIATYAPAQLWIAIGTNDYALNKWTAANFGTAYADLLDKLHTALPSLQIFAQSPTVRTTETANAGGSTLPNYRTEISTAAAARSSYVTYINGATFLSSGWLADGVHFTTAGQAAYHTAVRVVLGI